MAAILGSRETPAAGAGADGGERRAAPCAQGEVDPRRRAQGAAVLTHLTQHIL